MRGLNIVHYIFIAYFQSFYIDQLTPFRIEAVAEEKWSKNKMHNETTRADRNPNRMFTTQWSNIKKCSLMEKVIFKFHFIWKDHGNWSVLQSDLKMRPIYLSIIPASIVTCLLSPNTMNKQKLCFSFALRLLVVLCGVHWFRSLFIVNKQIKYQHVNECDGIWFGLEFITKYILE